MRNPFRRDKDPFAPGAYSDVIRSVRTSERKHMKHWWQWALLGLFALIVIAASYGTWLYYSTQGKVKIDAGQKAVEEGRPFNALLVGSDSRGDLTAEEQLAFGASYVPGQRADTLILAHVDPATQHITMVQFPRDLYVAMPDGGEDKINAALEDGHKALVRTVEKLTGLPINKYALVNIAGFRDLVDAIGGVDVCIPEPIPFDPATGLEVPEPGMIHFDGVEALRFVRSRRFATGDFERIQNQQKFLSAALNKVTSTSTLLNLPRLKNLADIAGKNMRTSETLVGLRGLLSKFRVIEPEKYEVYTAPNLGIGASPAGASIVLPDEDALKLMFEAIAANESPQEFDGVPDIDPGAVEVAVLNGTFEDGLASGLAAELVEATDTLTGDPVEIVATETASRQNYRRTMIRYESSGRAEAELVAAALPEAELVEVARVEGGRDVEIIVGSKDIEVKRLVQLTPIPIPPPSEPPPECR